MEDIFQRRKTTRISSATPISAQTTKTAMISRESPVAWGLVVPGTRGREEEGREGEREEVRREEKREEGEGER